MPIYRVNGLLMHVKMAGPSSKHPKACRCDLGPGAGICLGIATLLCDWPLEDGGTCDMPLCTDHATEVGPDRHYCPRHAAMRDRRAADPQGRLF